MAEHMDVSPTSSTVTVVLTPGRSGSSLVTEILGHLGLGLSRELISGRSENARGFHEDSRIVAVHKNLFERLGARAAYPLPDGWLKTNAAREAGRQLEEIVRQEVDSHDKWGFKDPRTSVLLPMWERVFNRVGVVPNYVFAIRHPGAVAASLRRLEDLDERLSESMWLYRVTEALRHTAAAGFFVHYEDWFQQPRETARGLARWCGLKTPDEAAIERIVSGVITGGLNKAGVLEQEIHNPLVERLYGVLRDCNGETAQRERLLAEVLESRKVIHAFSGWSDLGLRSLRGGNGKGEIADSRGGSADGKAQPAGQEAHNQPDVRRDQVAEVHRQLREIKKLEEDNQELRVRLQPNQLPNPASQESNSWEAAALDSNASKSNRQSPETNSTAHPWPAGSHSYRQASGSLRYRVGDAVVLAVTSPGRNTLKLPLRLYRLFREGWRRHRRGGI